MLTAIWKWLQARRRRRGYDWMVRQLGIHGPERAFQVMAAVRASRAWSPNDPYCQGVQDALALHTTKRTTP